MNEMVKKDLSFLIYHFSFAISLSDVSGGHWEVFNEKQITSKTFSSPTKASC
jgi:hypothetical protein